MRKSQKLNGKERQALRGKAFKCMIFRFDSLDRDKRDKEDKEDKGEKSILSLGKIVFG